MPKNGPCFALCGLALAAASTASAETYHSFDPVTMATGGTGVAFSSTGLRTLTNPASLSAPDADSAFAFTASGAGRAFDQDDLADEIDAFQDAAFVDSLEVDISEAETALQDFANSGSSSDRDAAVAALRDTSDSTLDLNGGLQSVAGRPAEVEFAGGLVGSRAGTGLGVGVTVAAWGTISGTSRYEDDQLLTDAAGAFDACADALENNTTCDADNLPFLVDTNNDNVPDDVDLNPETDLQSRVLARGLAVSEIGLTLSREFTIAGRPVALGITPKSQSITTFDYVAAVDDADSDQIDADTFTEEYTDFNVDLGAQTRIGPVMVGAVARNVLGHEYETALGNTIEVDPQVRAGVAYTGGWGRVGLDVDVTDNDSSGFADPTRFVSVGGALDLGGWAELRAGYRTNASGSARDSASLGLGLSPFGVAHLDLAVAGGDGEAGFAADLSVTF